MPKEFFRLARLATMLAGFTVLAACGGGGGSVGGGNGGNPPGGGGNAPPVTVSGKITFDRLVFSTTPTGGLNANAPVESPAREIVVQAVAGSSTLATTTTDVNGDYSLTVAASTNMIIRARAQMQKTGSAPTWTFTVRDNTDSDAVYALDSASFNSGTTNVTGKNLRAPSDWNGSGYNAGRRAAPFAIIDTVYQTKQLILSGDSTAQFPELNLYWSEDNRPSTTFCPDQGNIGTSFYVAGESDNCTATGSPLPDGIYILGSFQGGDTDEYDSHVIAHEFGHYFEDRFSRSDSIGGSHGIGDRLDLRVAFGEGWGNAFGSMALNDPQYRDSSNGISRDFGFNLESDSNDNEGWFSEASVGEFLWDAFDNVSALEPSDNVSLGFAPIYAAMRDPRVTTTDALTSIFSFASALRAQTGVSASAVNALLNGEDVANTDEFGTTEGNDGGDTTVLPIYGSITRNTPIAGVCSNSVAGSKDPGEQVIPNKLGNHRFFRFVNDTGRLVAISAQGFASGAGTMAATDPDIYVIRRGNVVLAGEATGGGVETINQQQLDAGTYIIDVFDYDTSGINQPRRCMTLSITGP